MEKRFFGQVVAGIFGIVGLIAAFNYVIDPFGLNGRFDLGLPKAATSRIIDYRLYKTVEFATHPAPVIVLGDSRCDAWRAEWFTEFGEPRVYNLAFGGGTLREAIDAFWFADSRIRLERVYLCIPFNLYNAKSVSSLMPQAREIADDPVRYYLSPLVTKASWANVYARVMAEPWRTERPLLDKEAFWRFQLEETAPQQLDGWAPPIALLSDLERIARYCRDRGIDLQIVIPPTHVELQDKVAEYGHERQYRSYRCALARLVPVVDFDRPSALTRDHAAFNDPYHVTPDSARRVVGEIVSGEAPDARVYAHDPMGTSCQPEKAAP